MDNEALKKEIRAFIVDTFLFGEGADSFTDSDSFMQTGIVGSTGILEVTGFIEEKFDFSIENEEMTPINLDSVDNLVAFIGKKVNS